MIVCGWTSRGNLAAILAMVGILPRRKLCGGFGFTWISYVWDLRVGMRRAYQAIESRPSAV